MQNEAVTDNHCIPVITIVGKSASLSAILPSPKIAVRLHSIRLIESPVGCRYLEQLDSASCESVHKQRQ